MSNQPILAPLLVQNLRAYFKRFGLYAHVDLTNLKEQLDNLNTVEDLFDLIGLFYDQSPMFQTNVQTPDGKLARMFELSAESNMDPNTSLQKPVVNMVQMQIIVRHPAFGKPFSLCYMAFSETDILLQTFKTKGSDNADKKATTLFYHKEGENFADPSVFKRLVSNPKTLLKIKHVINALDAVVRSFPAKTDSAITARDLALKGYEADTTYQKTVNPNMLDNLARAVAMVDAGLQTGGKISQRLSELRTMTRDVMSGYDVVSLFNGYRDRVMVPALYVRSDSNKRLIDLASISVITTTEDYGPLDAFSIAFSLGENSFALQNMLFELSTETGELKAFNPEQVKQNITLEQTVNDTDMQSVNDVVANMLSTFVKTGPLGKLTRSDVYGIIRQVKATSKLISR